MDAVTKPIVFEVLEPADIERFRELLHIYAQEFPGRFSNRINEDLAELPGRYAAPTGGLFLATLGSQPVATGAWTHVNAAQAEIKRVFVLPASRGHGIAQMLSHAIAGAARAAGHRQLVLSTWDDNIGALALYRKLGFVMIEPFKTSTFTNLAYLGLAL